jgi:hypothetical protein
VRTRRRLLLPTSEQAGEEAAFARRAVGRLLFQLGDAGLSGEKRLFLDDDCLRHQVGRPGLRGDARANEGLGLRIACAALALDLGQLAEEPLDGVTVLVIHWVQSFLAVETTYSSR